MEDQEKIQTLIDMGIPPDVANNALRAANGNVEAAVNYIFSNELPPQASQMPELPPRIDENSDNNTNTNVYNDNTGNTIPISGSNGFQPGDLNKYLTDKNNAIVQDTDSTSHNATINTSFINNTTTTTSNSNSNSNPNTNYMSESDIDIDMMTSSTRELSTDIRSQSFKPQASYTSTHKLQISDPTVLLPLSQNCLLENYLSLFLYSLCMLCPLQIFETQQFNDLMYNKKWYSISNNNENTTTDSLFLQLQRVTSIINSRMSERAFISTKMFSFAFNKDLNYLLSQSDHLNEIFNPFIESLVTTVLPPIFKDILVTTAINKDSQTNEIFRSPISMINFLPEEYESNLYKMFNNLVYPNEYGRNDDEQSDESLQTDDDDNDDANDSALEEISPIFTILFEEYDESDSSSTTLPEGVEIPLQFYPQLYSKKVNDQLIKHIISKRKEAQSKSRSLLNEINSLKSFQGKDIMKILQSTIDYIEKDSQRETKSANNLTNILTEMKNCKNLKMDQYKELTRKLHSEWNLSHPEGSIIETAKQLNLIDSPYNLSMVIFSPDLYLIKKANVDWYLIDCRSINQMQNKNRNNNNNNNNPDLFVLRKCNSEIEIQDIIKQKTRNPSETPLMFIYCKESFLPNEDDVMKSFESNMACTKFLKEDQLTLNESNMNSGESDIDMDQDDHQDFEEYGSQNSHYDASVSNNNNTSDMRNITDPYGEKNDHMTVNNDNEFDIMHEENVVINDVITEDTKNIDDIEQDESLDIKVETDSINGDEPQDLIVNDNDKSDENDMKVGAIHL
ncbi:hypothetical protein TBLA_0B02230 [Henningerozyma blattae CBS 6284]|uniref:UBA domain-containing protein n=1 Tax=Henningerozyma blattae (strain ATCC 34711 / CBS 6284 / DSM 70876 / NBRC 10599 / NRRL Y-10934 / UCD 77-7) TaxID=1071380 RepID=I2GY63_HENB6|nr:hypothetical protein TBLA_0B02230 [Tetrapisispora blattae CBS 6284]CCH59065.1 hypothetical protein TBLA_0B02230 [Tetrapisispora blattae CBS 6284]